MKPIFELSWLHMQMKHHKNDAEVAFYGRQSFVL